MASLRDSVVAKAESQLGVRYWTMHCGPKGSASEGFGCAMLVCWCLNQALGTSYYGSCWNLWGDAIGAPQYNQGGGEFEVIDAKDAQPGDIVMYFNPNVNLGYSTSASHTALYVGDGMVIGAWGRSYPGAWDYMAGGSVRRTTVAYQSLGGAIRYIRCRRLKGSVATNSGTSKDGALEVFKVSKTITTLGVNIRDYPSTKTGKVVGRYPANSKVSIDQVVINDGYAWGSYIGSSSGKRRYIALGSTEYVA